MNYTSGGGRSGFLRCTKTNVTYGYTFTGGHPHIYAHEIEEIKRMNEHKALSQEEFETGVVGKTTKFNDTPSSSTQASNEEEFETQCQKVTPRSP